MDPEFLSGGANPKIGDANLYIILAIFPENCTSDFFMDSEGRHASPTHLDMCSGCEQSCPDHTARKFLPGLARQMFRPDYAHEEPERRLVRTPVSVPVMLPVGLRRSGSSGSQQNTFSNSGGLNLLHPKVVALAPPYSQRHAHMLWYTSTLNYNSPVGTW